MVEDAKKVLDEMGHLGFKPSRFEYRVVIQWYGRLGSFKEMRRVIGRMGDAEIGIDTVYADLVLSCYVNDELIPTIIDGKSIAQDIRTVVAEEVRQMNNAIKKVPGLAIVLFGFAGLDRKEERYGSNVR
ncbi:uncharacterized protein A4U43_C07F32470 [Asparagus officinalis]|uniref:Pentacotripeptide-repeat region of PRORP domain-containing protein n=1 Tax=Asparagus officinalis TaxID=4686 RepID=A0A5P1EGV9_ASPOF|nr:uncharacterized protein A4U43_C07F32470 [Asparagus officinalis]